ncbi:MAG: hypothetical protein CMB99_10505 [Flavobacteriaceae bacterium]|nr:hypothetical protein [Flavobacteriaceae bacterium]|tara:strand:+ start:235741 stop:236514 length:774 start_codon:yes stop_codon:yes gene_type:complete
MKKLIFLFLVVFFFSPFAFGQDSAPVEGEYHAVLIGINEYSDSNVQDLVEPAVSAAMLGNLLSAKYTFKPENVTLLLNATKNNISKTFFELRKKLKEKDNLLIFFAGHSGYNMSGEYGYWMPSDVEMEFEVNILLNSEIVNHLKNLKAKHILLISDGVFAGNNLTTRSYSNNNIDSQSNYISREAMTNGMLKSSLDKSVFFSYLFKRLKDNTKSTLTARSLFNSIEDAVINNSNNIPQFGTIRMVGDEGGRFIFVKK